jgi:hypothetical protein
MPKVRPKPNPDVLCQRLDDEIVLMNLKTDRIFELNETAALFWELLIAGEDLDTIQRELSEEFEVSPGDLGPEIERIIQSMKDEELLLFEG